MRLTLVMPSARPIRTLLTSLLCGACSAGGSASPQGPPGGGGTGGQYQATTGGAGGAATGSGGTAVILGGQDAKAPLTAPDGALVLFDWPQTTGRDASACKAGHYVGTFSCSYVPPGTGPGGTGGAPALGAFQAIGPVEFNLTESQNGEYLEVSGGTLNGSTAIFLVFTGNITGKLDCLTDRFDGMVTNGQYGAPGFPPGGYFEGPIAADYSASGPALVNGDWSFTVLDLQRMTQGTCPGTWSATYTP